MQKIPVSIITGFLGSGKTTLLNQILKDPQLRNTAVIVNEFGDVGIDHLLVEQSNDGVIELSDGCLCCTIRGELVDTLADLIDRMQIGKSGEISRIIIETTGLAEPAPVLQAVIGHPVLTQNLILDAVICTVDSINAAKTLSRHEEAVKQLAVADRIVVTKTDIAPVDSQNALRTLVRRVNPAAPIVNNTGRDPLTSEVVSCDTTGRSQPELPVAPPEIPEHSHAAEHDHFHHDVNRHSPRIRAVSLKQTKPISRRAIGQFVDLLRSAHADNILRFKGVFSVKEHPDQPMIIHGAQAIFHPPIVKDTWAPDAVRESRVVVILMDMDPDFVETLFNAFADVPAIDSPDRQALEDNPLAVPGIRF